MNFPQIYLFYWTGKIVCQMSIDDSVILSSDHARVEEQVNPDEVFSSLKF